MSSLAEALPAECARVRELIPMYLSVPMGFITAGMMEADLRRADAAMMSGDVIAMLQVYESLKGYES